MAHQYEIVEALGVKVVPVPGLPDTVALVRDQRVALIRDGLDEPAHTWALDWLIHQAASLAARNQ